MFLDPPHEHKFLHWYRRFHSVLVLALCSYSGSHILPFDKLIIGHFVDYYAINDNFVLRRTKLASLDMFLGSPAWVFQDKDYNNDSLCLSIRTPEFGDLWGSVQRIAPPTDGLLLLTTGNGFIKRLHPSPQPLSTNELACYWSPDLLTAASASLGPARGSHLFTNGSSSSTTIPSNVPLPETATLLICPHPGPPDGRKELHTFDSSPNSFTIPMAEKDRKIPGIDHSEMAEEEQLNLRRQSKDRIRSLDASPKEYSQFDTFVTRSGYRDDVIESISSKEECDSSGTEGNSTALEETDLLALWPKVKRELIEKLIQDHKSVLIESLGIITCAGGDPTSRQGGASRSTDGASSQSGSSQRGHKRLRDNGGSSPPDDDQNGRKKSRPNFSARGSSDIDCRRLACHFYVRNPLKYRDEQACTGPGFLSINSLK